MNARKHLLKLLRLRAAPVLIDGGRPKLSSADIIEREARIALEEFELLPQFQELSNGKEIVRRLVLKNIVMLSVASVLDTKRALKINSITKEIVDRILGEGPALKIVR